LYTVNHRERDREKVRGERERERYIYIEKGGAKGGIEKGREREK
jgi:hypothetical protein